MSWPNPSANCQSHAIWTCHHSQERWPPDGKLCVFHETHHFEKCRSGDYTWVMLCFCASRSAPWRRRRVFYRIPFTSSMPSVGLQQAQWFTAWPAHPQWCDFISRTTCVDLLCHLQTQDDFQGWSLGLCKTWGRPSTRRSQGEWERKEVKNCVIS